MATLAHRAPMAGEPVVANDPAFIDTPFGPVVVFGHHLVSKKDLVILGHCLNFSGAEFVKSGSTIKSLLFRDDNKPKEGKTPVLGNVSFDHNSIAINLMKIVSDAIDESINHNEVAIVATYHRNLIITILHEIHHLSALDAFPTDPTAAQEEEDAAEAWAKERLFEMAKTVDIEPAHHSESPFLCKQLYEVLADDGDSWAVQQRKMLDNHLYFFIPENVKKGKNELAIYSFKEYMRFQSPDFDNKAWINTTIMPVAHMAPAAPAAPITSPYSFAPSIPTPVAPSVAPTNTAAEMQSFANVFPEEDAYDGYMEMEYDGTEGFAVDMTGDTFGGMSFEQLPGRTLPAQANPSQPLFQQTASQAFAPQFQPQPQQQVAQQYQAAAPQTQPQKVELKKIYQDNGLTDDQIAEIAKGVYHKIYNHLFGTCGPRVDSDIPFDFPKLVYQQGIPLTEEEQKVVVKMDCFDVQGRLCDGTLLSESKGMLHGKTTSKIELPSYKIYLNVHGYEMCRYIFPQSTKTPNGKDGLTKPALDARAGAAIMYVKEGNDAVIKAGGKTWLWKIVNGKLMKG